LVISVPLTARFYDEPNADELPGAAYREESLTLERIEEISGSGASKSSGYHHDRLGGTSLTSISDAGNKNSRSGRSRGGTSTSIERGAPGLREISPFLSNVNTI
jgi:hypothetical protein